MRRVWLLALALAPAVAGAQAAPADGAITFDNSFISSAECAGTGNILLSWDVAFITTGTGVPAGGEYHVYASNEAHTSPNCHIAPDATPGGTRVANEVVPISGTAVPADGADNKAQIAFQAQDFAIAAGKTCPLASRETIYVCVQGTQTGGGDPKFGFAVGSLIVDTRTPPPPVLSGNPEPGDQSLWLSWTPGTSAAPFTGDSRDYVMEATPVGSTAGTPIFSPRTTDTSRVRFEGLTNDVTYQVRVYAFSEADNQSPPSNAAEGTPQEVRNFFDMYRDAGGRELGGCAGGPAGIASLAAAAGLLAALRRRK